MFVSKGEPWCRANVEVLPGKRLLSSRLATGRPHQNVAMFTSITLECPRFAFLTSILVVRLLKQHVV